MDSSQIKTTIEDNEGKMSFSESPICTGQKWKCSPVKTVNLFEKIGKESMSREKRGSNEGPI